MTVKSEFVHISKIAAGDTVMYNGIPHTVCKGDIRHSSFMGPSVFGDTYKLGQQLVERLILRR